MYRIYTLTITVECDDSYPDPWAVDTATMDGVEVPCDMEMEKRAIDLVRKSIEVER